MVTPFRRPGPYTAQSCGAWNDPRILVLSHQAVGAFIRAWWYASDKRTDGRLTPLELEALGVDEALKSKLLSVGLWEGQSDGGILIADYLKWNRKASEIEAICFSRSACGARGGRPRKQVESKQKPKSQESGVRSQEIKNEKEKESSPSPTARAGSTEIPLKRGKPKKEPLPFRALEALQEVFAGAGPETMVEPKPQDIGARAIPIEKMIRSHPEKAHWRAAGALLGHLDAKWLSRPVGIGFVASAAFLDVLARSRAMAAKPAVAVNDAVFLPSSTLWERANGYTRIQLFEAAERGQPIVHNGITFSRNVLDHMR